MTYQFHEYANLFPMMDAAAFAELKQDIQENGLLEPVILYDEKILDGRNRYTACVELGMEPRYQRVNGNTDPLKYVISRNLKRRHLNESQRAVVADKVANVKHGGHNKKQNQNSDLAPVTLDMATSLMNVSRDTVAKVRRVKQEAPELIEKIERGEMTAHEAHKKVNEVRRNQERAKIAEQAAAVKPSDRWRIYHGDVQTWKAPRQYDFIVTDPPYLKEYTPLYEQLAIRANEWLKDGGLMVVMCGQSYLDEIYCLMSKHIDYYWTAAYLTPGQPTPLRQRQVNTTWKPLLMFSKGDYKGRIFGDVFRSDGNDKSMHKWGQSESGMMSIISGVCLPGQYILDPFCGAGTTGIAALRHGCLFDGLDNDEKNVKIATGRLGNDTPAN